MFNELMKVLSTLSFFVHGFAAWLILVIITSFSGGDIFTVAWLSYRIRE